MAKVLLVDDEKLILNVLSSMLKNEGYEVVTAENGEAAVKILREQSFDLLMSDIRMAPVSGMELLRFVHDEFSTLPVILLTAYGSVKTATEALKLGAFDYITKPIKVEEVLLTMQRALDCTKYLRINEYLSQGGSSIYRFENIVAKSQEMRALCERIEQIAVAHSTVLMHGERGTGKQLVARAIHKYGPGKDKPFLAINCAELPEPLLDMELFGHPDAGHPGLFEKARGGTVLLDEIAMLPSPLQDKLIAIVKDKKISEDGDASHSDVQIIATAVSDIDEQVRQGAFREDLHASLSAVEITIKPLRERPEDILPLLAHLFHEYLGSQAQLPSLSPEIPAILERYSWPGNVGELVTVVTTILQKEDLQQITRDDLPEKIIAGVQAADENAEDDFGRGDFWAKSLKAFLRSEIQGAP